MNIFRGLQSNAVRFNSTVNVDRIVSLRSLPAYDYVKSGEEIRKEMLNQRSGGEAKFYDGALLQWKKARTAFKFFQVGITNVWRVNRDLRKTLFSGNWYITDYSRGDVYGKLVVRRRDYKQLIDSLSERVSLLRIERANGKALSESDGILISRKQFIEVVRDAVNFKKLPLFGFLFLVFEELSLPLLYLFPKLLPTTCVMPGILSRRYYSQHNAAVLAMENEKGADAAREFVSSIVAGKVSPYGISESEIVQVYHYLGCHGRVSADSIARHVKTVLIDDYLLLRECGWDAESAADVLVTSGNGNGNGNDVSGKCGESEEFTISRGLVMSGSTGTSETPKLQISAYLETRKAEFAEPSSHKIKN